MISVFCGSKVNAAEAYRRPIRQLFTNVHELVGDKLHLAYGGGCDGLMKEVYDVCLQYKIPLTSINCHRWKREEETLLHETVYYSGIIDRQNHLVQIADAYVVCPGGVGTLYEMLQVITLNDVKESNKPVFVLNFNNYFMHLFDWMEWARKCSNITKTNAELNLHIVDNPTDLAQKIADIVYGDSK